MRIEVINTGTELMLGNVLNSHLGFISAEIFPLGLRVTRQATVPDGDAIRDALRETFGRADAVFVTGGLGPTTDDVTREITCELLGLALEHDEEIWQAIVARFSARGLQWSERVKLQALRPREATVLANSHGTAPGLYFSASGGAPHVFLLPGPPRELHPMVREKVLPILRGIAPVAVVNEMRTFRLLGTGESMVEESVGAELLALGLEVGYCARPGEVDIRLIGQFAALDAGAKLVAERLGEWLYTADARDLESVVVAEFTARGVTLACAESCTGGSIAAKITDVPGASLVLLAGYVTYANSAKTNALGVPGELIAVHGAVSEPVARSMALGALEKSGADIAVATTGIAGPGGGSAEKPVGTVFIACARRGGAAEVQKHRFIADRAVFKQRAAQTALRMALRALHTEYPKKGAVGLK